MKKLIGIMVLAAMTAGCAPRLVNFRHERNLSPMAKAVRLADVCYTHRQTGHKVLICEYTEWDGSDLQRVSQELIVGLYAEDK